MTVSHVWWCESVKVWNSETKTEKERERVKESIIKWEKERKKGGREKKNK